MTIVELKDERKVLNEKTAELIKEFESKCEGVAVSYISLDRFDSSTPREDVVIINTDITLGKV